jgi:hypothetical protein
VKSRFLRIRAGDRRFFDRDTSVSVGKANKRRHHNMAAKDGFPLPPSHQPETLERPGPGTAWAEAVTTPRILKAGILGVTMTAIVLAVMWTGNPLLFANATASLVGGPSSQDGTSEERPTAQSTAGTEALPSMGSGAPTEARLAAPLKAAGQSQVETGQAPTEALLGQFQAWAGGKDIQTEVVPVQPGRDAQAGPAQDARAEIARVQKQQPVWRAKNAQAEIRSKQNDRGRLRSDQYAQFMIWPGRDPRALDRPVRHARAPSLLHLIGLRD